MSSLNGRKNVANSFNPSQSPFHECQDRCSTAQALDAQLGHAHTFFPSTLLVNSQLEYSTLEIYAQHKWCLGFFLVSFHQASSSSRRRSLVPLPLLAPSTLFVPLRLLFCHHSFLYPSSSVSLASSGAWLSSRHSSSTQLLELSCNFSRAR